LDGRRESGPLDERIGARKRQHRTVLDFEGANENLSICAHFDLSPDVIFAHVVGVRTNVTTLGVAVRPSTIAMT
jgi:hypothetical protein